MLNNEGLEVKSTSAADLSIAFEDFMRAFEAFKETNDRRLSEIERYMSADVVTVDKLARIDRALDENKRVIEESSRSLFAKRRDRSSAHLSHARPAASTTRQPSRATCAGEKLISSATLRAKVCRSAQIRMAAISCQKRPSAP